MNRDHFVFLVSARLQIIFFWLLGIVCCSGAIMKTWLHSLPKEQLAVLAMGYGLESTGTLNEIRRCMREYADAHPDEFASDPREHGEPSFAYPQIMVTVLAYNARAIDGAAPAIPDSRIMR